MSKSSTVGLSEMQMRAIWDAHGPGLARYATGLLDGDRYQAEDVVQEAMLRLWQRPEVVDQVGSLGRWLLRVTHNIVIDVVRRRAARPTEVADARGGEHASSVGADISESVLDRVDVASLLSAVSPARRAALVEVYMSDRSVDDAARVLGLPSGTVKSRCFYGLRQLRMAAA